MDRPEQLTDLTGHVVRISTELLFRTGSAYFIELQLYMDQADGADSFSVIDSHRKTTLSICQPTVFLILTESHSESLEKLQVHAKYNFLKVKQVVWQQSVEAGSALNRGNQDIRCHAESVPSWYSMTGQSTIKSLRYQYTDNNSDINQLIEFSVIDSDMSCCRQLLESFKSPINLLFIDLTVMISNARIYSSFLKPISIVDRGLLSALEVNIRIKVYKCHEDGWMEVGPPSFRLFVYMSHYRRNFDVTSIKEGNFIMLLSVLPIYLWGRLQGFACTIRSTISSPLPLSLSSSKCLPTSVMVSIHSSLRHNLRSQLPIPSDIKKCSYLYNAWKCYQLTKLQAHYFNSDTITRLLNFIVELSLSSIRLSAADKMSSRDHGLTLLQLCKLPARAIQHEFASASHLELFMIRSGHDSDWLNSQLPQFVTPSELNSLFNSCSRRNMALSSSIMSSRNNSQYLQPLSSYISSIEILPYFESVPFLYKSSFLIGLLDSFELCTIFPDRSICLCKLSNMQQKLSGSENPDNHQILNRTVSILIQGTEKELQTICRAKSETNLSAIRLLSVRDVILLKSRDDGQLGDSASYTHYLFAHASSAYLLNEVDSSIVVDEPEQKKRKSDVENETCHSQPTYLQNLSTAGSTIDLKVFEKRSLVNGSFSLGVRDVLHMFKNEAPIATVTLSGVIQQKNNSPFSFVGSGYQISSKCPRRSDRQMEIILRDNNHVDVIAICIPFEMGNSVFVGSIVQLQGCTISQSPNYRSLVGHVDHAGDIGIVGVVSLEELQHLIDKINQQPLLPLFSSSSINSCLDLTPIKTSSYKQKQVPKTYLSILEDNRNNDYCLSNIIVRIVSIKRFTVSLKCSSCRAGFVVSNTSPTGYVCRQCQKYSNLQPYWHVIFNVEDNSTGEAIMECEGSTLKDALFELLGASSGKHSYRIDLEQAISRIESHVICRGYCKHDSFFISRKVSSGACVDNLSTLQQQEEMDIECYLNNQNFIPTSLLVSPSVAEDMNHLLDLFDFASLYQCMVKIIHGRPSALSQRKPISKVVKFQELDRKHPYIKNTAGVSVFWTETLLLECLQLSKMREVDVKTEIEEKLLSTATYESV